MLYCETCCKLRGFLIPKVSHNGICRSCFKNGLVFSVNHVEQSDEISNNTDDTVATGVGIALDIISSVTTSEDSSIATDTPFTGGGGEFAGAGASDSFDTASSSDSGDQNS